MTYDDTEYDHTTGSSGSYTLVQLYNIVTNIAREHHPFQNSIGTSSRNDEMDDFP